jgi:Zn-dependent alcohol dehydrogenases
MCQYCNDPTHLGNLADEGRRRFMFAGAGLAATPFLAAASNANAQDAEAEPAPSEPFETRAYGAESATANVRPLQITRRGLGPDDVLIDVHYCGICHSDIHQVRDEWNGIMTTLWPSVPGHEMTGVVRAVGANVTRFQVGDTCGVGCMVNSCGECESCKADLEQHCLNPSKQVFTYNSPDPILGGHTYGGWSEQIVVPEKFVLRVPRTVDQAAFAPLLCAGVTTFSPIRRWDIESGARVGVVGLGGLGHIAVKLAVSRGADVTVFTTTPAKIADAKRLGASDAVLSTDAADMQRFAGKLDVLLVTIPESYSVNPYLGLLKVAGTLVNIGNMMNMNDVNGAMLVFGRKNIGSSLIGGIAETQQVIDYCATRNIKPEIELVRPDQINEAMNRVKDKSVRYRFVIDLRANRT